MRAREISMLLLSAALGFVGGGVNSRMHSARAEQDQVVRATRFELVDQTGRVRAFWGRDSFYDVLAFQDEAKRSVAVFGVRQRERASPFLDFAGQDGKSRATLELGWKDRPIFALSDEKWEGRVLLGFMENDAPGPDDADWALRFQYPHRAVIGVLRNPTTGELNGTLILSDGKKQLMRVPKLPNNKKN